VPLQPPAVKGLLSALLGGGGAAGLVAALAAAAVEEEARRNRRLCDALALPPPEGGEGEGAGASAPLGPFSLRPNPLMPSLRKAAGGSALAELEAAVAEAEARAAGAGGGSSSTAPAAPAAPPALPPANALAVGAAELAALLALDLVASGDAAAGLAALRRLARASYGWFSPRLALRAALAVRGGGAGAAALLLEALREREPGWAEGGRALLALALRARLLALQEAGAEAGEGAGEGEGEGEGAAPPGEEEQPAPSSEGERSGSDWVAAALLSASGGGLSGGALPVRALRALQRQLRALPSEAQRDVEGPPLLRALLAWWGGARGGAAAALRGGGELLVAALGAPPLLGMLPGALFPLDSEAPALPLQVVQAVGIPPALLLAAAAPRLERAQALRYQ